MNMKFFADFAKKLKLNKIAYKFLSIIFRGRNEATMSDWQGYMSRICPDSGKSCIRGCNTNRRVEENLDIIIPVYNCEQYVAECIDSAINQRTKYSYRILIVDDGSVDNSPFIIDHYESFPIVSIFHQDNRGAAAARNLALEHIRSDYVLFLDADDRLPEYTVERLLNKAYEDDYDIVGGGYTRFGKYCQTHFIPTPEQLHGFPCGKLYKSSIFQNIKFPENYWFEDTIINLIIPAYAKKTISIQTVVYYYRKNKRSATYISRGKAKVIDTLWITYKLVNDRKSLGLPFDNIFFDCLIHQFAVNTRRIYTIGDKRANLANFLASKELYNEYCSIFKCQRDANKPIETALQNDDYWQFVLACLFL